MKIRSTLLLLFLSTKLLLAHEVNEAFFTITENGNTVEVEAEFPWTMRNALIAFNPSLEHATDKNEFESTFVEYIKTHLILKDINGNILEYLDFKQLENNGHSHQSNYLILFRGNKLHEVINTIMFNVNDNQENYHTIDHNTTGKIFTTNKQVNNFYVPEYSSFNYWYVLLLLIPLFYIIKRYFILKGST